MAFPFFSLSKSHRTAPIDFNAGGVSIRVEAVPDHGMATIWDADILIWAASQVVEARDAGLRTSRLMVATPYEILRFIGRGTSLRDYQRLKAALDRLQSTTICTSIRQPAEGRRHRFSWINEWKERTDRNGKPDGIELILPDWFYQAVLDDALVLTIDRAYFGLTGGLDRWLYRIVRKHGGRQRNGWRFDFRHLHQKSGALSPFKRFAFELRNVFVKTLALFFGHLRKLGFIQRLAIAHRCEGDVAAVAVQRHAFFQRQTLARGVVVVLTRHAKQMALVVVQHLAVRARP